MLHANAGHVTKILFTLNSFALNLIVKARLDAWFFIMKISFHSCADKISPYMKRFVGLTFKAAIGRDILEVLHTILKDFILNLNECGSNKKIGVECVL